ncbi:MAG TPA: SCP2 sterol-binding domain-containing protein [Candidatus Deferrimicrobium sp.]|nr:SCP2 sterol-binding domain-containing protein [Candidatus Deferrimicrobium sp.]
MTKKKIALRMLLGGLHYCASELIKEDPNYKAKIEGINAIMQWKSVPDGPNTYTIIKDTKIEFNDDGIHEHPDFTMICKDLDLGLEIFKGRNPISKAIKNGDIEVIGDKEKLLKITFYLEDLIPLIGELAGVQV